MTDWMRQIFMLALVVFEGFCICRLFQAFALPRLGKSCRNTAAIGAVWVLYHGVCLWGNWAFYPSSLWNLAAYFCVMFAAALVWYQGSVMLKLFLVVQFAAIHELSIWAANSLLAVHAQVPEILGRGMEQEQLSVSAFMSLLSLSDIGFVLAVGILRDRTCCAIQFNFLL